MLARTERKRAARARRTSDRGAAQRPTEVVGTERHEVSNMTKVEGFDGGGRC